MRSVLFLFICVALSSVNCAVYFEKDPEIPGFEGQCYDKDQRTFYYKGDIIPSDSSKCMQTICLGSVPGSGEVRKEIHTCPKFKVEGHCSIIEDPSKPYPDCCPQPVPTSPEELIFCQQPKLDQY